MACEVPCITTSLANNALGARNGEHIRIGDSKEEIANEITSILSDEQLANALGKQGKEFVLGNYSWENEAKRLSQIMELTNI